MYGWSGSSHCISVLFVSLLSFIYWKHPFRVKELCSTSKQREALGAGGESHVKTSNGRPYFCKPLRPEVLILQVGRRICVSNQDLAGDAAATTGGTGGGSSHCPSLANYNNPISLSITDCPLHQHLQKRASLVCAIFLQSFQRKRNAHAPRP